MKVIGLVFIAMLMSACHKHKTETVYVPGPTVQVAAPVIPQTEQDLINNIVDERNEYLRLVSPFKELDPGLVCKFYTITNGGHRIQAIGTSGFTQMTLSQVSSFVYEGEFNQPVAPISDGLNILPAHLAGYLNGFLVRCEGTLIVTKAGTKIFELNSDDASLLYIDGALVVNNDNSHGPTVKTGSKLLTKGAHTFRLDYSQSGGGSQALILKMNTELLSGDYLFF